MQYAYVINVKKIGNIQYKNKLLTCNNKNKLMLDKNTANGQSFLKLRHVSLGKYFSIDQAWVQGVGGDSLTLPPSEIGIQNFISNRN